MERTAWTDDRLNDFAGEVRAGFARLDARIDAQGSELRTEMRTGFARLDTRIDAQGVELRGAIDSLRQTIIRVGGGMMIGLVGVIAAVLVRGV